MMEDLTEEKIKETGGPAPIRLVSLLALLCLGVFVLFSFSEHRFSSAKQINSEPQIILPPAPVLSAHAYLVQIIGDSKPILKQRAWKPLPPASITKLITALLARELFSENTEIIISKEAKAVGEKISKLEVGTSMRRDEAIKAMLVESANDIAYATGEVVAMQADPYVENKKQILADMMNAKAKMLGMAHTSLLNPTGLDEEGHKTSAEDLFLLSQYLWYNDPWVWEITRNSEATVFTDRGEYTAVSTNVLLQEFPALRGGKTGLTDAAKGTLVLLYPLRNGKTAIVIILGSDDRFEDGRKIIHWLDSAFPEQ